MFRPDQFVAVRALATALAVLLVRTAHGAAPLDDLEEQAFKQAAALADPSIVRIETIGGLDVVGNVLTGTGPTTGVVVSADGFIITSSFNFVSRPASVLVTLPDGRRFPADVVAGDRSKMLTLLKIEHAGLTPISAAPKNDLRVGQWAIALGRTYDNAFPNVSVGIISALGRIWGKAVQTDAKVSPANYGGPLVDVQGRAIGILVPLSPQGDGETAGVEWYDGGIGFAIPLEDVYAVLDRLKAGEQLKPGLMGVTFGDLGPLAGEPRIDRVRPESPADKAGIKVGDVIIEADGRPVARVAALRHILGTKYAGEPLALALRRGEETLKVELTLVAELLPWESAFLGILPARRASGPEATQTPEASGSPPAAGVEVREVLADSPAAKADLQRRDVITAAAGEPVANAAALLDRVSRVKPGEKIELTYRRDGRDHAVSVELATLPEDVPDELPSANIPSYEPPAGQEAPRTGRFTDKLPGGDQEFWCYVPQQYNPAYGYALLVWLHSGGDTQEASMMRLWQSHCDRRGMILVGPKAAEVSGWTPGEADFVRGVVEHLQAAYTIDPARIVVHGHGDGGQFAFHVAFRDRNLFRGIAAGSAPLRAPPPDNDPEFRQQLYVLCGEQDPLLPAVTQTVSGLKRLKFPVTFRQVPEAGESYPDAEIVDEIGRWIDALDRI
jgi:serine protease Do